MRKHRGSKATGTHVAVMRKLALCFKIPFSQQAAGPLCFFMARSKHVTRTTVGSLHLLARQTKAAGRGDSQTSAQSCRVADKMTA